MAEYRFETELAVAAPITAVYATLVEPERWLPAWRDATCVRRVRDGDPTGAGAAFDATVRAPVGYRLSARIELVETEPPTRLRMRASGGLVGSGVWCLGERGGLTEVRFAWNVRTTATWMNLLAPLARPLFERSHGVVVRHAGEAAAAHLGTELARFRSTAAPTSPRTRVALAVGLGGLAAALVTGRRRRR